MATTEPLPVGSCSGSKALWADLKQIGQAAGVLGTVITLMSLGLPALIAWITEHLGPAVPIWKAFAATAPLTLSVACIGTGIVRGWLDDFWQTVFVTAGTLVITAGIGHCLGLAGWIDLPTLFWQHAGNPLDFGFRVIVAFLVNYWKIYGTQQFCSSLLVGSFLAWAWGVKLLPHCSAFVSSIETQNQTPRQAA